MNKPVVFRQKIEVLFPEIGRVKIFYHSPARIVEQMCIRIYIFNLKRDKIPFANLF